MEKRKGQVKKDRPKKKTVPRKERQASGTAKRLGWYFRGENLIQSLVDDFTTKNGLIYWDELKILAGNIFELWMMANPHESEDIRTGLSNATIKLQRAVLYTNKRKLAEIRELHLHKEQNAKS